MNLKKLYLLKTASYKLCPICKGLATLNFVSQTHNTRRCQTTSCEGLILPSTVQVGLDEIEPQANLALVGLPSLLQCSTCLSSVLTWDGGSVCLVEGGGREWVELTDRESQCCSFSDTANGFEISRCHTFICTGIEAKVATVPVFCRAKFLA